MEHIEIGVLTICYFLVSLALLFQRNHNVSLFLFYVVLGYLWSRACFVVCGDIRERESSFWWWNSWCVLILSLTLQNFIRNLWWNVVIFHLLLSQFGTLAFIIRLFSLNSMRILIWWLTYVCISIHSSYLVVNRKTFILVTNYKTIFNARSSQKNIRWISTGSTATTPVGCRWHAATFGKSWMCKDTCWGLFLILKSCYQVRLLRISNIIIA